MQASFVYFVHFPHRKNDYVISHKHHHYELVYYKNGRGNTTINQETFKYFPNTIALIEPNIMHDEFELENSDVYCLEFKDDNLKLKSMLIYPTESNTSIIKNILKHLQSIEVLNSQPNVKKEIYDIEVNYIISLIMQLLNYKKKYQKVYKIQVVNFLTSYIKLNYNKGINFEMLSSELGYSYHRLRHIFKDITGLTFQQYLDGIRLSKAKDILINKNDSMALIASKCGFNSQVRFSIWFKERVGISPLRFRKIQGKEHDLGIFNPLTK